MKRLCRAIVWDVIVLGGNRKGGKLFGGNYVNSIYLGSIIQGQLSGWQLCGYNHQWWITLRGSSLTPIAQKLILWGKDDYQEGNIFGGNYPKRNYPRGGRGQLSGSNYLGLNCPALIIVYREVSVVSWNLLNDPKHRVSFYKKMTCSEEIQLRAGDFHVIIGKLCTFKVSLSSVYLGKI